MPILDVDKPLPPPPFFHKIKRLPSLPSVVSIDSVGGLKVPRNLMAPKRPEWFQDNSKASWAGLVAVDSRSAALQSPKARRHLRFCPEVEEILISR